jgi:hypothetical protein
MINDQQRARVQLQDLDTACTPAPTAPPLGPDGSAGRIPQSSVAALHIRRGPYTGQRFALPTDTTSTLGRHPSCDIVLPNVTVSRRHTEIRLDSRGFVLIDVGSLNGTYLNGHPVDTAVLAHGDEIAIGVFRLTFHTGDHNPRR